VKRLIAHKLIVIALVHFLGTADAWTSNRDIAETRNYPAISQFFTGTDGKRYQVAWRYREVNPLLGRQPTAARLFIQINAQDLVVDWRVLRGRRDAAPLYATAVAIHLAGIADNLALYRKLPAVAGH
jgi:hypothetical protein